MRKYSCRVPSLRLAAGVLWCVFVFNLPAWAQEPDGSFTIARVKYGGGGDWYSNQSSLPNLLLFIRANTNLRTAAEEARVELGDDRLFSYTYLYMNGHGNIRFSDDEVRRLRTYLTSGGFLHADDNYGMEPSFMREMHKVFPDKQWLPMPFDHPVFHMQYEFPQGLPKIHEHDGGPPKGLGLFHDGRLIVLYSGNTDLGDGWEDPDVHKDPEEVRRKALEMGANIVIYALTH